MNVGFTNFYHKYSLRCYFKINPFFCSAEVLFYNGDRRLRNEKVSKNHRKLLLHTQNHLTSVLISLFSMMNKFQTKINIFISEQALNNISMLTQLSFPNTLLFYFILFLFFSKAFSAPVSPAWLSSSVKNSSFL